MLAIQKSCVLSGHIKFVMGPFILLVCGMASMPNG